MEDLSEEMDSEELSEWMAFDRVYGLPDTHQRAILTALTVLVNLWSSKQKFTPEDFLGTRKAEPRRQSDAVMKSNLMAIIAAQQARGVK